MKRAIVNWKRLAAFAALAAGLVIPTGAQNDDSMTVIPSGIYKPLFRTEQDPKEIQVKSFRLDVYPVTNSEFLEFVKANPKWQRSKVKPLFADENYLKHWAGDLDLGPEAEVTGKQPVTHVSWFAARAYAAWRGKRLPTTAEWEYAAGASETRADGENDPAFRNQMFRWLTTPSPKVLPPVGAGRANFYGVHDLHGLVWEWPADFNNAIVTGESRGDTSLERNLFCGSGSQDAKDRTNYAAFMRYAFRSSLKGNYTVANLGFRCAKDL